VKRWVVNVIDFIVLTSFRFLEHVQLVGSVLVAVQYEQTV